MPLIASPSSATQQAPSTPWRRAPRAAPPSRAMVAWARLVQQAMVSSHSARQAPWRRRPSMPAEQRLLKRQKVVSSGAGLVYFCGFARHLLAGFLRPTELARTARACVALRDTLATCVITKLVPPFRRRGAWRHLGWSYSIVLSPHTPECIHDRRFYNLRQCLICLHAMRMSPARSHQSLSCIEVPPPDPGYPLFPRPV